MDAIWIIIIAVAAGLAVMVLAGAWLALRKHHTSDLQSTFGREYEYELARRGKRSDPEKELDARKERVARLDIRKLDAQEYRVFKRDVTTRVMSDGSERTVVISDELPEGPLYDAPVKETDHEAVAHATEESVVYTPGPWDFARGWVRSLTVWVALALVTVEAILAFRFGFLLGGANPANGFVDVIYDISGPLVEPFVGIASTSASGDGVFDPATVTAMAVYLVGALLVMLLIWAVTAGPAPTSGRRIATSSHEYTRGNAHDHH